MAGDWRGTADILALARRKGPATLNDNKVDRAWRNVQRELRSMQLRRAVSLWREGIRTAAVDEATNAARSDEAYVRTGATVLLVANDLGGGRRKDATAKLEVIAGRDRRFTDAVKELERALHAPRDPGTAAAGLQQALAAQDRSADFITRPLVEIVIEAMPPQLAQCGWNEAAASR